MSIHTRQQALDNLPKEVKEYFVGNIDELLFKLEGQVALTNYIGNLKGIERMSTLEILSGYSQYVQHLLIPLIEKMRTLESSNQYLYDEVTFFLMYNAELITIMKQRNIKGLERLAADVRNKIDRRKSEEAKDKIGSAVEKALNKTPTIIT